MKFFAMIGVFMASVAAATPDPALQAEIAANRARGVCGPMPPCRPCNTEADGCCCDG
ncbi:hypothetical protein PSPO01_08466 [Paraphaeosphaeria sporulosa]